MTKSEVEELYIRSISSGEEIIAIKMTINESHVFRVLIGRIVKEMEKRNPTLYYMSKGYGIEYKEGYLLIRKHEPGRFQLNKIGPGGEVIPFDE